MQNQNTFEDIAFLLGQCKGKNWNLYIFWLLIKWNRCYCKTQTSVQFIFATTIATLLIFQPKESFWKFMKYFWRYSISARTGKREILNFLHFLDVGKVVTLLLQNQNICAIEIFNHNSHLPHRSAKKKFLKFVKYFWRYSISPMTV